MRDEPWIRGFALNAMKCALLLGQQWALRPRHGNRPLHALTFEHPLTRGRLHGEDTLQV